jgi:beta-glucosidase
VSIKNGYGRAVTVELDISNSGQRLGEEVVQVYLGLPATQAVPQPTKQLKGFAKVSLGPGQTRRVRVNLDGRALAYWNADLHDWSVLPGTYRVLVGSSSRDIRLQGSFVVR